MIIWTSNVRLTNEFSIKAGVIMFRDIIQFNLMNNKNYLGFELGIFGEYFSTSSNQWLNGHSDSRTKYAMLNLRKWSWEESHIYYDGPHCSRSFGYLHFFWCDWECKKCYDE